MLTLYHQIKTIMIMKKETNEKFELTDVIGIIAFVCGILTMIFGYHPKEEIIDNIFFYGLGTLLFTIIFYIIIYIIIAIITVIVAFVMTKFTK